MCCEYINPIIIDAGSIDPSDLTLNRYTVGIVIKNLFVMWVHTCQESFSIVECKNVHKYSDDCRIR